jgi:hypothetical protein
MLEFMQQDNIIMSELYCERLKKKLGRAIQNQRHGMLTSSVVFLHDNEYPYTTTCT